MRRVNSFLLGGLGLGAMSALLVTVAQPQRDVVTVSAPVAGVGVVSGQRGASSAPGSGSSASTSIIARPSATVSAKLPEGPRGEVAALVPDGHVSAEVFDRTTQTVAVSIDAHRHYTSASLVKILIAFEALDRGTAPDTVQEMLSRSDDQTANRLWVEGGGKEIVRKAVKRMELPETTPPSDPGRWGDTEITAADITRVYRYLMDKAPADQRTVILDGLRAATESGADGFRQYFGIPDAFGNGSWAVKQGWSCCNPMRTLHTSGLVADDRYIVTVLTDNPRSVSYDVAGKEITAVVKHLLGRL